MPLPSVTVTTDADGAYVIERVAAGDAQFHAWSAKVKAYTPPHPIHIDAGKDRIEDLERDRALGVNSLAIDQKARSKQCRATVTVRNGRG